MVDKTAIEGVGRWLNYCVAHPFDAHTEMIARTLGIRLCDIRGISQDIIANGVKALVERGA